MSKPRQQHIKNASIRKNPESNKTTLETVGKNLKLDPNTTISGYGVEMITSSGDLNTSIVANKNAKDAAKLANKTMNETNASSCSKYNEIAKNIELNFANDPDKWMSYGFEVTKNEAKDHPIPDKPTNCSMLQGAFPKTCTICCDVPANAVNYTVEITKGDPKDDKLYIIVKSPKIIFTTTSITFDVPDDYLNAPLWAKITAHNAAGPSPASEPFGGMRIQ